MLATSLLLGRRELITLRKIIIVMGRTYKYDFEKVEAAFNEWKKVKTVGKPSLGTRIQDFERVIDYAEAQDVDALKRFIFSDIEKPIIFFGAGGGYNAAIYAAMLCNLNGRIGIARTPMMVNQMSTDLMRKCKFVCISAKGRTIDLLSTSMHLLSIINPKDFAAVTLQAVDDRLNKLCKMLVADYPEATVMGFDGKVASTDPKKPYNALFSHDEFVGTKKHVAFCVLLYRCFYDNTNLAETLINEEDVPYIADLHGWRLENIKYWNLLHGGLGEAAANDLEVRLSEGSLAFPMMTDFKNFTHGRHAFVYEHQHETAIVTFETKQDRRLADEIISRYHANADMEKIPTIRIKSDKSTPLATIELLIKSMYFALDLSIALGLNLSKPNAPKLGVWEMDYYPFMDFD